MTFTYFISKYFRENNVYEEGIQVWDHTVHCRKEFSQYVDQEGSSEQSHNKIVPRQPFDLKSGDSHVS